VGSTANVVATDATTFDKVLANTDTTVQAALDKIDEVAQRKDSIGATIVAATAKTTPIDADSVGLSDSADGGVLKKLTWANLKATLLATAMTWTGNQTFSGFTVLGAGPAIKMKKLTGTTGAAEGNEVSVAHGLTGAKIVSITAKVTFATNSGIAQEHTGTAGYQYHLSHDATNVYIKNHATNSENILSKALVILITYEE
jgi:hypothetical protein